MERTSTESANNALHFVEQVVKKEFDANRRVLSFDEYLGLITESPQLHTRGSAEYLLNMMDHFGKDPVSIWEDTDHPQTQLFRFRVFDLPVDSVAPKIVGHAKVQTEIYRTLKTFVRQGSNNRLLLLHGPNGSAKSTLIHGIMGGIERYSHEKDGANYSFNWVFPVERFTKGNMGLGTYGARDTLRNFSKLPDEEIAARIPCELKDHPLLLIPKENRKAALVQLLGESEAQRIWSRLPSYLSEGDLCHRCKQIANALMAAHQGDYARVLSHIQVERFYFSRRYRNGLVTIEPQLHVDARANQITLNKSLSSLPASLQSLNLFSLSGDLIEGNRGLIEYSDMLKRPVDTYKYLLVACETGAVTIGSSIAYMDSVLMGSSNELQLDAFKEFPDFSSFKARIKLIRVPYLLSVSEEKEIYSLMLKQVSGDKFVAPHVAWSVALWAVLTRLKKPNSINYPPNVSSVISNLSPLDKARLYDTGDMPESLTAEERKLLRSNFRKLTDEYTNIPYYEGRVGASAREVRSILFDAAHDSDYPTLSPLAVMKHISEFCKKTSEYDFLKQDVKDGYHDVTEFVNVVKGEYLGVVDREVRDSLGLYDTKQWEEFIKKYVLHTSHVLKKEKIRNTITGRSEDPDFSLIREFEKIVGAGSTEDELNTFRRNVISRIGAWSLDHKDEEVRYSKVFPEYYRKLEKHFYESQKSTLTKMHHALQLAADEGFDLSTEGGQLAKKTIDNMVANLGYNEESAREVITFLMKNRY